MKLFNIEVPCRKCLACRIAHSREWAIRLMHENAEQKKSGFVTLTYGDEYLPKDGSLIKADLQKYLKRLRYIIEPKKIKYFAVGDYGEIKGRPHFHLIEFGLERDDHEMQELYVTEGPLLDAWGMGNVFLGTVTAASCRYVTDYIFKAFDGSKAKEKYGDKLPPFKTVSQGMGLAWVKRNQQYLEDNLCLTVNGQKYKLPRYYYSKMDGDKENISKLRAVFRSIDEERKLKRLKDKGISGEVLIEYLSSSRYQRNLELVANQKRKSERLSLKKL